MQQRRLRPGDVLDDYCPRERRITDHAIVAMIEDHIKQTRCVVCDAEHEYKEAKVPPQRRKKAQAALFTQVLDGLQGPQPAVRLTHHPDDDVDDSIASVPVAVTPVIAAPVEDSPVEPEVIARAEPVIVEAAPVAAAGDDEPVGPPRRDEGFFRRSLIRATLPRVEGQQPPTRAIPDFTIRQPGTGRSSNRPGGRRRGGAPQQPGPMRFGRDNGNGNGNGGNGQRSHGRGGHGNGQGPSSHGRNGHGQGGGRRRGGKKR